MIAVSSQSAALKTWSSLPSSSAAEPTQAVVAQQPSLAALTAVGAFSPTTAPVPLNEANDLTVEPTWQERLATALKAALQRNTTTMGASVDSLTATASSSPPQTVAANPPQFSALLSPAIANFLGSRGMLRNITLPTGERTQTITPGVDFAKNIGIGQRMAVSGMSQNEISSQHVVGNTLMRDDIANFSATIRARTIMAVQKGLGLPINANVDFRRVTPQVLQRALAGLNAQDNNDVNVRDAKFLVNIALANQQEVAPGVPLWATGAPHLQTFLVSTDKIAGINLQDPEQFKNSFTARYGSFVQQLAAGAGFNGQFRPVPANLTFGSPEFVAAIQARSGLNATEQVLFFNPSHTVLIQGRDGVNDSVIFSSAMSNGLLQTTGYQQAQLGLMRYALADGVAEGQDTTALFDRVMKKIFKQGAGVAPQQLSQATAARQQRFGVSTQALNGLGGSLIQQSRAALSAMFSASLKGAHQGLESIATQAAGAGMSALLQTAASAACPWAAGLVGSVGAQALQNKPVA